MDSPPSTRLFEELPCEDVVALTVGPVGLLQAEMLCADLAARGIAFHTDLPFDRLRGGFGRRSWRIIAMGRMRSRMPVSVYVCRDDLMVARPVALRLLDAELVAGGR
jgi:hypothetical protein